MATPFHRVVRELRMGEAEGSRAEMRAEIVGLRAEIWGLHEELKLVRESNRVLRNRLIASQTREKANGES